MATRGSTIVRGAALLLTGTAVAVGGCTGGPASPRWAAREPKIVVVREPTYVSRFPTILAVPTSPVGPVGPAVTPGLTFPAEGVGTAPTR